MTTKYTDEEWKEILQQVKTGAFVPDIAREYNLSRNQIYLKLRQQKKKSFWNKFKELLDGILWKLP